MKLKIEKRDGRIVPYNVEKIESSIQSAMDAVGEENGKDIVSLVEEEIKELGKEVVNIEKVQNIIEECLMDLGYNSVARAYIKYREKRKRKRLLKEKLEVVDDLDLGLNAAKLLKDRYLRKDETGNPIETPSELFRRVAHAVAQADLKYDDDADIEEVEELFYRSMTNMEFLPNSPTLFSAGTGRGTLAACFVDNVPDNLEGIFQKVKESAIITKMGGGYGVSFSDIRPKGDVVGSTSGVSSGVVSFMRVFDTAIDVCKQGGVRRGALMGCLRVDHPDILEFIRCKQDQKSFRNFNISVLITDEFMEAYYNDDTYELINPRNNEVVEEISARTVMNQIVLNAHGSGDPGLVFIDRANKKHPIRDLEIKGVNVCGEQILAPGESCLLGAINLSEFVKNREVDYSGLKRIIDTVVHFLDNLIDINRYPLPHIEKASKRTRKIGVGIMGWAEMLIKLGISYDSDEGVKLASEIMEFINKRAHEASRDLAKMRGNFPLFNRYKRRYKHMRNAVLTTIAPTGSRSLIAGTSGGIEPLFAIAQTRFTGDGESFSDINDLFVEEAKKRNIWNDELKMLVSKYGSLEKIENVPEDLKRIFKTAHEIPPKRHVDMQAAFQEYVGSSVSKTVNLPNDATIKDVEDIFIRAFETGCKGITIFRDGCLSETQEQPLQLGCELCEL